MRLEGIREHLLQLSINRRKAAIVTYLKNGMALFRRFEHSPSVGEIGSHGLLTKDVLALFDRKNGQLSVFRIRSSDVDRVAHGQYFRGAVCQRGAGGTRHKSRSLPDPIVDRGDLDAFIARQN